MICNTCQQNYPANRDNFPPHDNLAFEDRPCVHCRKKIWNRRNHKRELVRKAVIEAGILEARKQDVINPPVGHDPYYRLEKMKKLYYTMYNGVWYRKGVAAKLWLLDNTDKWEQGSEEVTRDGVTKVWRRMRSYKLDDLRDLMIDNGIWVSRSTIKRAMDEIARH